MSLQEAKITTSCLLWVWHLKASGIGPKMR